MATIVDDFLQKFHSLEGVTIADKRRNYFKLLHQVAPHFKANPAEVDALSSNLKPKNFLENLLRVEFLIYFRRIPELLQLLKEGNDVFVSKISKQVWFFKKAFDHLSGTELVNEILPCMSFCVRMKILRNLSRYLSCERFEEIYDAVEIRYGQFLASRFITGCGPAKIKQILTFGDHPKELTSTQLRILYGKDPALIDFYFNTIDRRIQFRKYKEIIKFIFENDRALFDSLQTRHKFSFSFGRRATKKFVVSRKEDIIKNPYNYQFINLKAAIRKMGKDSLTMFIKNLPEQIPSHIYSNWVSDSFPSRYQYSLHVKTFQDHYNILIENHPSYIVEKLLLLIPEKSERAALAKIKVNLGYDEYIKFLLPEESIPMIKEKSNLTSDIHNRGALIRDLIETCYINDDIEALLTVMKYFNFRHKNDDLHVHLEFINNIERKFGFSRFTEEMWDCINELLVIHMLKFDHRETTYQKIQTLPLMSFNIGTSFYQKLSYLEFLFSRGQPIDGLLKEYFSTTCKFPYYENCSKEFGKYLLLFYINNFTKESSEKVDLDINYRVIMEFHSRNAYQKDDQLSLYDFPTLLFTFNYIIRNGALEYPHILEDFRRKIFTTEPNIYRDEYLQIYWERHDNYLNLQDIAWFLKYDPLVIVANFEPVFKKLTEAGEKSDRLTIWQVIKKYSHLQLDQKFVQVSLEKLSDDTTTDVKPKFVVGLSMLMKPLDFAAFADSYKPLSRKLDIKNVKDLRLYTLQCAIASRFKNSNSYEVIPALLNYCTGDYLKYALKSLYSLLYHTPEDMVPQHLTYLSTKAVSVRKHALFLTCELCTRTKVEDLIRLLYKQQDVQSLKKHLFAKTIQYFVKNPSDSFFELVLLNMDFITKTDEESLKSIVTFLEKIPAKYKARYIQHAWNHFEKTVDAWKKLKPLKDDVLRNVNEVLASQLPLEFGLAILDQHFMTLKGDRDLHQIDNFMFNFLNNQDQKSLILEKIIARFNNSNKQRVSSFLTNWNYRIMDLKHTNLEYFAPYVNYYENHISFIEDFPDFLLVFYLKSKLEAVEYKPVDDFVVKFLTFFEEIITKCGPHVTSFFGKRMSTLSYFFKSWNISKYEFYLKLVQQQPVPIIAILLLDIMTVPSEKDKKIIFSKILSLLLKIDDVGVQINLQFKFRSYMGSKDFLELMEVD